MKQDELIKKIFDNLNGEKIKDPNTTLSKTALRAIGVEKLRNIYNFLSQGVLSISDSKITQRPECPIKHIKQQNQATAGYKRDMIQYIGQFGLVLEGNPCDYTPGILERVANRCESILEK